MKALRVILVVVGLVALATPSWAAKAACAPDAVQVGPVCVDKYEASVWSIPPEKTKLIKNVQAGTATPPVSPPAERRRSV